MDAAQSSAPRQKGKLLDRLFNCPCLACCPFFKRRKPPQEYRTVISNHLVTSADAKHELLANKYVGNKVKTTKYSVLTFLPKNLFEQFHRFANLYFIFIVILNWIPQIEAFGRELSLIPVLFVLTVTAVKDAFEDWRRYKSDEKVNHSACRVWDSGEGRYRRAEWKEVRVGDFVHLSCNEIIPADVLLVATSDPVGACYVETSNLDGESNLKQRQVVAGIQSRLLDASRLHKRKFNPTDFRGTVSCEQPNNQIYRFNGFILHEDAEREALNKNNILLRGCELRNTDYVEGLVLYAGRETKAMLNNSGPRYKRSDLERLMNWDIVWCVVILLALCLTGAIGSSFWLISFDDPYQVVFLTFAPPKFTPELEGFINFWSFIIILQVMIPISLYVSIEIIKLGQIYFIVQDSHLYHEGTDRRVQCRALNIPEELGQIQYLLSDKTGTLTENQMIFRRCAVAGIDYGPSNARVEASSARLPRLSEHTECVSDVKANAQLLDLAERLPELLLTGRLDSSPHAADAAAYDFFINMAICNTTVVNAHPHMDTMNASGFFVGGDAFQTGLGATPVASPRDSPPPPGVSMPPRAHRRPPSAAAAVLPTPLDDPQPRSLLDHADASRSQSRTADASGSRSQSRTADVEETSFTVPEIRTERPASAQSDAATSSRPETPCSAASCPPDAAVVQRPRTLFGLPKLGLAVRGISSGLSPLLRVKKAGELTSRTASPAPSNPIYEAESPDELSLVYAASAYGFRLLKRQLNYVLVELPDGSRARYELLHTLPFDSERKRMSVIVKAPTSNRLILYCKGADSVMLALLADQFCESEFGQNVVFKTQQYLSLYSSYGLRTLCLARRELSVFEYESWLEAHAEAELDLDNREQLICESAVRIETQLELLGATGIEDRLQDGVPETISALRHAGIKVWVLTGDKIETAVNIAYASRLFSPGMELVQLSAKNEVCACECGAVGKADGQADTSEMLDHFVSQLSSACRRRTSTDAAAEDGDALLGGGVGRRSRRRRDKVGVVVDGRTLAYCLLPSLEDKLARLLSRCAAVLCCRATPLQKASVVRLVKERLRGKTLAIGDGANDVSMIQCADVGVGISGQEGMQAVMSSDYALARFRFLHRLLLVHGHWCYDRLARIVLFFFYKNALFVFTIVWFQIFCGFSSQVMIDPLYLMLYNLLFTSLPPLLCGVLDQSAPDSLLYEQPRLYAVGRTSSVSVAVAFRISTDRVQLYKAHSFWLNILDSLWQSLCIYFISHMLYFSSDGSMWSFGFLIFTSLVFVNQLHLAIEVRNWTLPLAVSLVGSTLFYLAFALVYNSVASPAWQVKDTPNQVALHSVKQGRFWLALLLVCLTALLPRFTMKVVRNSMQPTETVLALLRRRCQTQSGDNKLRRFAARWSKQGKGVRILPEDAATAAPPADEPIAVIRM